MKVYVVYNHSEPEAVFSSKEKAALHIFETRDSERSACRIGEETKQIAELDVDGVGTPTRSGIQWSDGYPWGEYLAMAAAPK